MGFGKFLAREIGRSLGNKVKNDFKTNKAYWETEIRLKKQKEKKRK